MHLSQRFLPILHFGVLLSCLIPGTAQAQSSWEGPTRLSATTFVDATEDAGLPPGLAGTMSIAWVDWDRDGWPDLWLGRHGDDVPGRLFLNQGNGSFGSNVVPDIITPYGSRLDQHGALWVDLDNDGDQDLIVQAGADLGKGAEPNLVFRNESTSTPGSLVRQEATGLEYARGRGRMPAALDYDGDGRLDILATNSLRPGSDLSVRAPARLFRQTTGVGSDFTFSDVSEDVGFRIETHSHFAQPADLSGDRRPDLLVQGSTFPARIYDFASSPFEDLTAQLMPRHFFRVKDAAIADFNGDLHSDLFLCRRYQYSDWVQAGDSLLAMTLRVSTNPNVSLDHGGARVHTSGSIRIRSDEQNGEIAEREHVYVGSQGYHPSSARDIVLDASDEANHGLVDPDTLDHSGHVLLAGYDTTETAWTVKLVALSGATNQTIIVSTPESTIDDFTPIGEEEEAHHGVLLFFDPDEGRFTRETSEVTGQFSCTNTAAGDFDNDGDVDLYLANAGTLQSRPNALFENDGHGNFREVAEGGGAAGPSSTVFTDNVLTISARAIVADYDRDGFLDLFTPGSNTLRALGVPIRDDNGDPAFASAPTQLFRNQGVAHLPPDERHYAFIDLVGTQSNRDAIGAKVFVYADGRGQLREQHGGVRHFAQDDKRLHVGFGTSTRIDSVVVHWPSGNVQRILDLPVDQTHTITEIDNTPPTARDDEAETYERESVEIAVLENDTDTDGGTLSIASVEDPANGTVATTDEGVLVYTPDDEFVGQDAFEYVLQDGQGGTGRAQVTVTVQEPPTVTFDLQLSAGWNLMSVPLRVEEDYRAVFSDVSLASDLLSFRKEYVTDSTLTPGQGYWLAAETDDTQAIYGTPLSKLEIDLRQGWNLIAGPNCDLPVEKIGDGAERTTPGTVYGYDGGYTPSDTLHPGKSYWLHAHSGGSISLDCNAAPSKSQPVPRARALTTEDFGRLIIRSSPRHRQMLYFGARLEEAPAASSAMPPTPPDGAFDARFEDDRRFIEEESGFIELQTSGNPVTVELAARPRTGSSKGYVLEELVHDEVVGTHDLQVGRTVSIDHPAMTRLRLQAEADRPDAFALHGNYPNPFQTTTTLAVDLPESAKVSVAVFDALGRRVMNLPEQSLYAGVNRTLSIDATQLASGLYFYQLRAEMASGTVTETGRMTVVK